MATLATLLIKLSGDISDYQSKMGQAAKIADDTGKILTNVGDKLLGAGRMMTAGVTMPLVGIAGAAVNAASNLDEAMNKVQVVFGESAEVVEEFASRSATSLGISERAALGATGTFGNLFLTMGLGQEPAAQMSMDLTTLAADLASFNNLDPQIVLDKLRSGLVGEVEPLRTLGVSLSEVTVQEKALEMGLAETAEELTQADKLMARYQLIMEQTTTAQGDFARTADGVANSTRIVRAQVEDAAAALGEQLLPYAKELLQWASGMIERFQALSPEQQQQIVQYGAIAAAIGPVLMISGQLISTTGSLISSASQLPALLDKIGMSGATAAGGLGLAVAVIGSLIGVLIAYNNVQKQVEQGTQQADDAWAELFGTMTAEGASAAEILSAYGQKQAEVNQIISEANPVVQAFLDGQMLMMGNTEALSDALATASGSYEEYVAAMKQAAAAAYLEVDAEGRLVSTREESGVTITEIKDSTYAMSEAEFEAEKRANALSEAEQFLDDSLRANQMDLEAQAETMSDELLPAIESVEDRTRRLNNEFDNLQTLIAGPLGNEMEQFTERTEDLANQAADLEESIAKLEGQSWLSKAQKQELEDLRTQLEEVTLAIDEEARRHTAATNQIVFNLTQQRLAQSGIDPAAQLAILTDLAERLGMTDTATGTLTTAIDGLLQAVTPDNMENLGAATAYLAEAALDGAVNAAEVAKALAILDGMEVNATVIVTTIGEVYEGEQGGHKYAAEGYQGWVTRPTTFTVGEEGPEYLSVTPQGEMADLSAMPSQPMGGGYMLSIAPGAIVIEGADDPMATARAVVEELKRETRSVVDEARARGER